MSALGRMSASGLHLRFGDRSVLDGCGLSLAAGEACMLTGDNGAGKTTLLRVLAGLQRPDAGTLAFDGRPLQPGRFPPSVRHVLQYVPAHPLLFSTSVRANLDYGLRARGVGRDECRRLTQAAVEWARLQAIVRTDPRRLSAGEIQRIAIARAWVLQPRVILFDEPTSNLDRASHAQVLELICRLVDGGAAVLVAAHDRALVDLPGTRRLHLSSGRLATLGP